MELASVLRLWKCLMAVLRALKVEVWVSTTVPERNRERT
jgi:hypothetical protein